MKFTLITTVASAALLFAGFATTNAQAQSTDATGKLETVDQKISYIVGRSTAEQFKRDKITIDPQALLLAIEDVANGVEPRLNEEQVQSAIAVIQARVNEAREKEQSALSETNKKEGEAFLKENGAKTGVITLASGLQYEVIKSGNGGAKPKASDTVTVHYRGTLINGTEFDSSYARGEPATFPLSGVIPGWTEIVQKMSVGDKWAVVIPSDLAYGSRGVGQDIGPDATLKFDIELLAIGE